MAGSGFTCRCAVVLAAVLMAIAGTASVLHAADGVGWRGDGTGRYPDAPAPAVQWDRRAQTVLEEFTSDVKPADENAPPAGEKLDRVQGGFVARQWLLIGPFAMPGGKPELEPEVTPGEASLAPRAGDRIGNLQWQAVKNERGVNFTNAFGKTDVEQIAFLCTYLYSPHETVAGMRFAGDRARQRLWLNGKPDSDWELARHTFRKGWNRLLIKVLVHARTSESNLETYIFAPDGPDLQYKTKNIAWTTEMPGSSYSMPIIVGDKLLVTSEPSDLACVDKSTGKILWIRSDTLWHAVNAGSESGAKELAAMRPAADALDAMTTQFLNGDTILPDHKPNPSATPDELARWKFEERAAFLRARRDSAQKLTDDVKKAYPKYGVQLGWGGGNSVPTPCSDGKQVYVWRGETGVLSCYDLDGKRIYSRFEHSGHGGEHGINASPQIVGDLLIVIGGKQWLAFERATGKLRWTQKYRHVAYASAIPARIGDVDVMIGPDGQIVRARDGAILHEPFERFDGECASPVLDSENPRQFYLVSRGGFIGVELPETITGDSIECKTICELKPDALQDTETYPVGSPLSDGGLVYFTHSGWGPRKFPVLLVVDPKAKEVVYRQRLQMSPAIHYAPDGAGIAASLTMAGRHIYCIDNRGETIVFEPGRVFRQIAKNVIEDNFAGRAEVTNSSPIFDAGRMYYRGEHHLYCVAPE